MIINHNMMAMNTHRQLGVNSNNGQKSIEKLSSGMRINRAGDDAAGLAISEKMRGQIRGLNQASRNAQDSISMIQTAEGALNETHDILQRMRELAVQSANDTNVSVDRSEIQKEIDQLAKEITRISNNTEFNTQKLINGGIKDDGIKSARFHVGANASQDIELSINAMDAESLGVARDVNTATGTVVGKVSEATFTGDLGTGIVDEAQISATYTAASAGTATAAKVEATYTAAAGDLKFKVDNGTEVSVTLADDDDIDAAIDKINAASAGTATKSGGKIILTSGTTGTSSSVEITGALAGFTTTTVKGAAATPTGPQVTLTSTGTGTPTQTIDVKADDTSINVTSGNFKGMKLTFTGAVSGLATSGTADKVTLDVKTTEATAATFASNEKTADATTQAGIDVSSQTVASEAITTIQNAIETVSAERSKLGAYQNRLEHTIKNLDTSSENLQAAESRIRDVDMAKEMMNFTKNNILQQAAQAMLAQANQAPQGVLQLLR